MARDTKPNLSNDKFEQFSGETLTLSGTTEVHGIFEVENGGIFKLDDGNQQDGYVMTSNSLGIAGWQPLNINNIESSQNITKLINQNSHNFSVGNVIGFSGDTYNKAIADGNYDGEYIGIVSEVIDSNNFYVTQVGYVTGLTSLSANTTYFLSPTIAGEITNVEPSTDGQINKVILIAESETTGWILPYPGVVLSSGTTVISTADNGLSNVNGVAELGGTLCKNTIIDGAYDLSFGTTGNSLTNISLINSGLTKIEGQQTQIISQNQTICLGNSTGIKIIDNNLYPMEYNADYSQNITARSIPDAAWVTGNTGSGTITGGTNGLGVSGANICLGGVLSTNTTISGYGTDITFDGNDSFNVINSSIIYLSGTTATLISENQNDIGIVSGSNESTIIFSQNCITVTDQFNSEGLTYASDYSTVGEINPRWIPDVAWVTGNTGGGGDPAGNDYEIQFNSGGTFSASSQLTYDPINEAFTAGYRTGTTGQYSVVLGGWSDYPNEASGVSSTAFGRNVTASGSYSTAFGISSTASGFGSTAFGSSSTANGDRSTAFGSNTIANDYLETVFGFYNISGTGSQDTWVETDNLFTIGNGTGTTRSNAFQIKKNGDTYINKDLYVSGITTADYLCLRGTEGIELNIGSARNLYICGLQALSKSVRTILYIKDDGTILSGETPTICASGSDYEIQYNSGDTLSSFSGFTYNPNLCELNVTGNIYTGNINALFCSQSSIHCSTTCSRSPLYISTTCSQSPIHCSTTCSRSPVHCSTTAFRITGTGLRYCGGTGCGCATDWIASSDIRFKKDIVPIESALSKINSLCGVCYNMCDNEEPDMGLIAQEVEKIEPRLVSKNDADEYHKEKYGITDQVYGLKYDKFSGLFVEAIKELKNQNTDQQNQINILKDEITLLQEQINKLKE